MKAIRKVQLRAEGARVFVNINDDTFLELEWQKADEVAAALKACARLAEGHEKAEQVLKDTAFLMRSGAPFTLSNDPRLLDAAKNEAAFDKDLRRQLPGGVKSREVFGLPTIRRH
jgi:hypothetical protein